MNSLRAAVSLFLDRNLSLADISLRAWSATYNVEPEQFMAEVERQQSERSRRPSNSYQEPEGK